MDIDRIAVVLHKAVLTKLQNEERIPETLTQDQAQASYDRVYDILQESMSDKDIRTNKIEIQKNATLRSIQELPVVIRDASKPLSPIKETPRDIQGLVEKELQKRGIQDQSIGATPPSGLPNKTTSTNTVMGSEQHTTLETQPVPQEYTPDTIQSASGIQDPPLLRHYTPRPPASPPPPPEPELGPVSTFITSPQKGGDELRWECNTHAKVLGITRVHLPHMFVNQYPYLLITITNGDTTITHPLVHKNGNWYDIPEGVRCMGGLSGSFRITITDPEGDVIPTKFTIKDVFENHTLYTKAVIHPGSGIAYTLDEVPLDEVPLLDAAEDTNTSETEQREGEEPKEENKLSPDDYVSLLFKDHSICVFFLTSAQ